MASLGFTASVEELQLSTRILEMDNWHKTDTLSIDAAIDIFKQSGLTFKQLRDIWSIADKKGSGSLSKHELAVVVRLMGWVQAGEPLNEALLASAGPMPFIKGITESIAGSSSKPSNNAPIPPINPAEGERFKLAFNRANPVHGVLDRENVTIALLNNFNLSYNFVEKIMNLVNGSHQFDFGNFALAFHLGGLLQSSETASLPSVIPQYLLDQVSSFNTPPPPTIQPLIIASASTSVPDDPPDESVNEGEPPSASQQLESDLLLVRSQIEVHGAIDGETILKLSTNHKVQPNELAQLWRLYVSHENNSPTGASLDLFLDRLKEKAVGQPFAISPYNIPDNAILSSPLSPTLSAPLVNEPSSTDSLEEIKAETAHLLLRVEKTLLHQSNRQNQLQLTNQSLRDENKILHFKVRELETKLAASTLSSNTHEMQVQHTQTVDRLTEDLQLMEGIVASLQDQHEAQGTALRECRSTLADSYLKTEQIEQSAVSLIANLRIQLEKKEKDMADLILQINNPDPSLRGSQASLAEVQDGVKNVRQVITTQHEEISSLPIRSTAEPIPFSVMNDSLLQNLARGHDRLSSEVEEIREMVEEFMFFAQPPDTVSDYLAPPTYSSSQPDWPAIHGSHNESSPQEPRPSTLPVLNLSASTNLPGVFPGNVNSIIKIDLPQPPPPWNDRNGTSNDSSRYLSPAKGGGVERYPFLDTHSPYDESTPAFDVVAFGQPSQVSQAATIDRFPRAPPPTPVHSQEMEGFVDIELQEIKAEGAKLSLHIERCLQQQITTQNNVRAIALTDHSQDEELVKVALEEIEKRRNQKELELITENLNDKKAEYEILKTQMFGLRMDLAEAKKHAERLQETVHFQNEEINSLQRNWSYLDVVEPPAYYQLEAEVVLS